MQKLTKKIHVIMAFSIIFIAGFVSLYLGQDANWDMRNYHYYVGYAFLNLKLTQDFAAGGLESYFNPLTDVVNYLMITYFPPKLTAFLLGAIQGINIYLLAFMTTLLFKNTYSFINKVVIIFIVTFLGLLNANVLGEIGTTFNDLTLANWALLALTIIGFSLKSDLGKNKKEIAIIFAGLSLGIGAGLKLTMVLYCIGALIALISLRTDLSRSKTIFLFLIGCGLGFIITDGYWMITLWKFCKSPIFPYYNKFFKSPYYYPQNIETAKYFLPRNIMQTFFYPFYFSWKDHLTNQVHFRDFRLPCVYLCLVGYCGKVFASRKIYTEGSTQSQRQFMQFLVIFFIASYIIWQCQFSIQRYAMVLDILAPLLIFILLTNTFSKERLVNWLMILIFLFLTITLQPSEWGRAKWSNSYFDVQLPSSLDLKESIVMNADFFVGYLRPFFPSDWHFISLGNPMYSVPGNDLPALNEILKSWSNSQEYNFYVLYRNRDALAVEEQVKQYGFLLNGQCDLIKTKIDDYHICPVALVALSR